MSLYDIRTVHTPSALPPKPQAKIKVPLSEAYLAELMAKEAGAVRARFHRKWGGQNNHAADVNAQRQADALAEREALAGKIMDFLSHGPRTTRELEHHFKASENKTSSAVGVLRARGVIAPKRTGYGSVWQLVEAAE